jgi:hypothetical protein
MIHGTADQGKFSKTAQQHCASTNTPILPLTSNGVAVANTYCVDEGNKNY